MAAEGVEHAGVDTFERFENADAGCEGWQRRAPRRKKDAGGDDGGQKIAHPCHGHRRRHHFHGQGQSVRESLKPEYREQGLGERAKGNRDQGWRDSAWS
jgi:hypothetical protein